MAEPKTWWIVGASEGLGRALAQAMDAEGARLIVSARNAEGLAQLAGQLHATRAVPMDVTDGASVKVAAAQVGRVDGIVYCVGGYQPMTARDWQTDAALAMTEVNFLGALRVLGEVLPGMIARNAGQIVLIGSLAGFRGLPGAIGYGASKAALMHLAENMRADLRGTALRVQIINPGFIDTRLTRKNTFKMPYLMTPEDAAARTLRAMKRGRFSASYPAPFSTMFQIGRYMPLWLFQSIF